MMEQKIKSDDESQINLGQIVGKDHRYELSVSNETTEDAAARRLTERADAELKRKMAFILFCFALALVGSVFVACIYTFATGQPDDKKWAGIFGLLKTRCLLSNAQ